MQQFSKARKDKKEGGMRKEKVGAGSEETGIRNQESGHKTGSDISVAFKYE
ncbi:MAG: hypothetical protein KBF32_11990 [Chitinophagales bacterium]|nr:hypothetical protein [Chitinophagales bacterium]